MNREEVLALTAERLAGKLLDFYSAEVALLALTDDLKAAAFGMAAIGVTASLLVAGGMAPGEAAARIAQTAAGVAEDLR